jgi:hypothetical protein
VLQLGSTFSFFNIQFCQNSLLHSKVMDCWLKERFSTSKIRFCDSILSPYQVMIIKLGLQELHLVVGHINDFIDLCKSKLQKIAILRVPYFKSILTNIAQNP